MMNDNTLCYSYMVKCQNKSVWHILTLIHIHTITILIHKERLCTIVSKNET